MLIYHSTIGEKLLPNWVPPEVHRYSLHTKTGLTIRHLARRAGCHASTVLRQIRRLEMRRDDPLVDAALKGLGIRHFLRPLLASQKDLETMDMTSPKLRQTQDYNVLNAHALRVLLRLCETGAILAVASGMDKAIVLSDIPDGRCAKTAIIDSALAQAFALKSWISCSVKGLNSRYQITNAGRIALHELRALSPQATPDFKRPDQVLARARGLARMRTMTLNRRPSNSVLLL